jgi:hypothetical protein
LWRGAADIHDQYVDDRIMLPYDSVVTLPSEMRPEPEQAKQEGASFLGCFFVQLPYGARVQVPSNANGEEVVITAVPGMRIVTPATAQGNASVCDCAPGCEKTVVASLPLPARVLGGSTLYLPEPLQPFPSDLAKRMIELGPEATGTAMGAISPDAVAPALFQLQPAQVASILCHARPAAAVAALQQMPFDAHLAQVLVSLPVDVAGAMIAHGDTAGMRTMLEKSFSGDDKLYKSLIVSSEKYGMAVELMGQPAAVIRRVVDMMMTLQPSVAAKLVSLATAPRAAFTLMRLAARDYKKASAIMDCLTDSSNSMAALGTRYKALDMTRVHLQQQVAFSISSSMLTARVAALMHYLKHSYGITATLIREMPDANVVQRKDTGEDDTDAADDLYETTKQVGVAVRYAAPPFATFG